MYDEADKRDTEVYQKAWSDRRKGLIDQEQFKDILENEASEAERVLKEWENTNNALRLETKSLLDSYMKDSGYDGIIIENDAGSFGRSTKSYIVFAPSQVKQNQSITYDDEGKIIPLSKRFNAENPDIRYSLDDLVDEYGAIPKGENPYGNNRDIDVPQQTSDFDKVSRFTRTAMEAEQINDTIVGMIKDELISDMQTGRFIYELSGTKEQVNKANRLIENTGWQKQVNNFQTKYRSGQMMTADDLIAAVASYRYRTWASCTGVICAKKTISGRKSKSIEAC